MNKLNIAGKVSKSPEVKTYADGQKTYRLFTVEVRNPFGQFPDRFYCSAFGKRGEELPDLPVGTLIAVSGRVSARAYVSQRDGSPKAALGCTVEDYTVLASAPASVAPADDLPPEDAPEGTGTNKPPF